MKIIIERSTCDPSLLYARRRGTPLGGRVLAYFNSDSDRYIAFWGFKDAMSRAQEGQLAAAFRAGEAAMVDLIRDPPPMADLEAGGGSLGLSSC